jgi:hypothetical protein
MVKPSLHGLAKKEQDGVLQLHVLDMIVNVENCSIIIIQ